MKILIPMAGEGKRFRDLGYTVSKPAIPAYDLRSGKLLPMVVCATLDLPEVEPDGSNVIYIERSFHRTDGTEAAIQETFPAAQFIAVDHLTEGQACTCMLAKRLLNQKEELLIAGCDNGMEFSREAFAREKQTADLLVFTYRNNPAVLVNPNAYGWMITDRNGYITDVSIKKAVSDTPMRDHAVVATFWFREANIFTAATERMISENDRINNEFYIDQAVKHTLALGYRAKVFEIDRYIGWGTPADYEAYQKTFAYWHGFVEKERRMF